MTEQTETDTKQPEQEYTDVSNWNWNDVVNEFKLDRKRFLNLYYLVPDMLSEQGYQRKLSDVKKKFSGDDVTFDREFVVQRLTNEFTQLACYNEDSVDDIMQDVKARLQEQKAQFEQERIDKINELVRELGLSKKELQSKITV